MGAVAAREEVGILLTGLEVVVKTGNQVVLHYKVIEIFVRPLTPTRLFANVTLSLLVEDVCVCHRPLKAPSYLGRKIRVKVVSDPTKSRAPSYMRDPFISLCAKAHMSADDIVFGGCIVMFTALKGGHFEGLAETRLFDATPDLMIEFSVRNLLEDGLSEFILFDVIRRRKSL